MCAVDHGLSVRPQSGLEHSKASRVCGMFVLAMIIAPAAHSVATIYGNNCDMVASCSQWVSRDFEMGKWETYSSIPLGWFVGPLCVPDRTIVSLHTNCFRNVTLARSREGERRTLVLDTDRYTMQQTLQSPRLGKFSI